MAEGRLHLVVRTPHELVADTEVDSLRVPCDTGEVGLRPRSEAAVLAVEPGLALLRAAGTLRFLATAGGILRCDGREVVLLTPVAVLGDDADEVGLRLDAALAAPAAERELRRAIERLEHGILRELREAGSGRVLREPGS
jgi:F0F1-type ATP synthase epsilon subunit